MLIFEDDHLRVTWSEAAFDERPMQLTRKEYELLAMLARNEGEIIPRDALLEIVWGYRPGIRTRTLDVHVRRLRRKLGAYGEQYIQTVFGVGYRFERLRAPRPLLINLPKVIAAGA